MNPNDQNDDGVKDDGSDYLPVPTPGPHEPQDADRMRDMWRGEGERQRAWNGR